LLLDAKLENSTMMHRVRIALFCICTAIAQVAITERLPRIVVSIPGPGSLSYLPIELIPRIGADRAENVALRIIHSGGGAVALHHLVTRNADFTVAGMPAAMALRANGHEVVVIAAVNDAPLFVLMVRATLHDEIRQISDLKGRIVGVNTSTQASKTTSQQLLETLLKANGVPANRVRIVPSGQSWLEQSALIRSATVDAVMGDEPFASRLLAQGQVFFLAHLAAPETLHGLAGVHFLHAALETRSDMIAQDPNRVAKMVRMVQRSLAWIAAHSAQEIVATLGVREPEERDALIQVLVRYPHAFSRNGCLSTAQLKETDRFFHASQADYPEALALSSESMVDDRWAGRCP
jgi:NitT/TauT family transport system substrate-binding protein